jgi:hypothetical protein
VETHPLAHALHRLPQHKFVNSLELTCHLHTSRFLACPREENMPVATPLKLGTYAPPTTRCVSFHSEVSRLLSLRPTLLFSARNFCTFAFVYYEVCNHEWICPLGAEILLGVCDLIAALLHLSTHMNNYSDCSNHTT